MRVLFLAISAYLLFAFQPDAKAGTVYSINVFGALDLPFVSQIGATHSVYQPGEGGWPGYSGVTTSTYHFEAAGIANFGTLTLLPGFVGCRRGCYYDYGGADYAILYGIFYLGAWDYSREPNAYQYLESNNAVMVGEWCTSLDAACTAPPVSQTYNLIFEVAPGDNLTLAWGGFPEFNYLYTAPIFAPPVPEPSTWVLVMVGFVGLGFFARQRRSRVAYCAA